MSVNVLMATKGQRFESAGLSASNRGINIHEFKLQIGISLSKDGWYWALSFSGGTQPGFWWSGVFFPGCTKQGAAFSPPHARVFIDLL